jgi:hypothetical protein
MEQFTSVNEALLSRGPVAQFNGRWFITIGHAGFNTKANNGRGYATRDKAITAILSNSRGAGSSGFFV